MWLLCILTLTLSQVFANETSVLAHSLIRVLFCTGEEWFRFLWLHELFPEELVQHAESPRLYPLIAIIQELIYPKQHSLISNHPEKFNSTTPNFDIWRTLIQLVAVCHCAPWPDFPQNGPNELESGLEAYIVIHCFSEVLLPYKLLQCQSAQRT